MSIFKRNIPFFLLLSGFIISSVITGILYYYKILWIGTIILCLTMVFFEGVVFLWGAGVLIFFPKMKTSQNIESFSTKFSDLLIIYFSISFFILFFVFPFAFVKSYQMSQIIIFACGVICPLILLFFMIIYRNYAGFSGSILGYFKIWHFTFLILLSVMAAGIKISDYNPAFFHINYITYVSNSSVKGITNEDSVMLKFSYQILNKDSYKMHLSVRSDNKLLFGKFGHGIVYGNIKFEENKIIMLDIYDTDDDDGDPAVSFNTKTGIFNYSSKHKNKGYIRAVID